MSTVDFADVRCRSETRWGYRFWITAACCLFWIKRSGADDLANLTVEGGEFCSLDEFSARCRPDHVIQVLNATFGRMRVGKCIDRDPGCSVDARYLLYRQCSALTQCNLQVSAIDREMKNITTLHCSKEHRLHLEAYYRCLPVESGPDQVCQPPERPIHVSRREGYLASVVTKRTEKGSSKCPWRIQGQPGQTIQISLVDTYAGINPGDGFCQIYAYVKDPTLTGSGAKLMDCGYEQLGHVFTSLSESVDVILVENDNARHFMLHFKAVGCPDIQPEGGAEVIRNGNRTQVVCGDTVWTVDCVEDEWIGEIEHCNLQDTSHVVGLIPWPEEWGQELTIVLIMAVAVVIAVIIVVIGVCIVRRRSMADFQPVSQDVVEYGVYGLHDPVMPGKCYYPGITLTQDPSIQCASGHTDPAHYTTTIQRRQAMPPNAMAPPGGILQGHSALYRQQDNMASCSSCPLHSCEGYSCQDRVNPSGWQTFPIRRPDHFYHSVTLGRKDKCDPPYYHELDPEEVQRQLMEQQNSMTSQRIPGPPSIPIPPIPQEDDVPKDKDVDEFPPPLQIPPSPPASPAPAPSTPPPPPPPPAPPAPAPAPLPQPLDNKKAMQS